MRIVLSGVSFLAMIHLVQMLNGTQREEASCYCKKKVGVQLWKSHHGSVTRRGRYTDDEKERFTVRISLFFLFHATMEGKGVFDAARKRVHRCIK